MQTPTLTVRLLWYLGSWLVSGFVWMAAAILVTLASNDPSAGAWIAFLPMLFPVFWITPLKYLLPIYLATECLLFTIGLIRRRAAAAHEELL